MYSIREIYYFPRIDAFQRLKLFRFLFWTRECIYTNNVPLCDNDYCETTNLVISGELRSSQGCTICVDTLHYLCRVCSENHLLKGIFYAWNVQFYRIESFRRLILFRIMLRIKGGIYTNDAPLRAIWAAKRSGQYQSWISAIYPETGWMWKKDKMFNLVIHGIFGFIYLSNSPNWCLSFIVFTPHISIKIRIMQWILVIFSFHKFIHPINVKIFTMLRL